MENIKEKIINREVVASTQEQHRTQLGYIFWYSVTGEVEITRQELREKFEEIGIDDVWLPNEIRPSDAFRRATKEIQRRKTPTSDPNKFLNFLVREVFSDNNSIQRNIVIEVVDQNGKRLQYNPNATVITLDKKNNDFIIWSEPDNNKAKELAKEAEKRFRKYLNYYSAQQLRVMISKILASLAPTAVRPNGGVYFVPQNFATELKKLQLLCTSLQSEGVAIPLQDTSENRNLVVEKLESELKELLDRCKNLEKLNGVQKAIYKDSIETAKRITSTYKTYKEQLSLEVDKLEDMLNELRFSAVRLTEKIIK
ncbi:hypothetical protein LI012_14635 [Caldibacillus thermoamylovorans]|uniref:DUF6744 family protein n=1 Tax=Caldibacillus thermoamylovorans TaxID=35841 RepID=UPI001D074425|nr:DUF6744 family protein [Caldibacillus thermoamylovorans]MCB5936620.1 hypothetical protein [Bacillus sp. DFI.2.34]MCB7078044.1 hypothetical protein [Caldibacillus thermoamylovorans]